MLCCKIFLAILFVILTLNSTHFICKAAVNIIPEALYVEE